MKKTVVCAVLGLFAVGMVFAEAAPAAKTRPEMVRYGGKGRIVFVNTCDAPTASLDASLKKITNLLMIDYAIDKGTWSLANAQKSYEDAKGNVAVFIVKDKTLPLSLVSVEAKWGVANVEGLDEQGVTKMALRVATLLLGGGSSRYPASCAAPAFSKADLAKVGDIITIDSVMSISTYLPSIGIVPYRMMTREEAKREAEEEAAEAAEEAAKSKAK